MNQVVTKARAGNSERGRSRSGPRGTKTPPTVRGQRTTQLLFEAAEAVFGEVGYDQASVSAITKRAGVAQGTFYLYFADKKGIFVELVHSLNDRVREEVLAAMQDVTGRMNIERARFAAFFQFVSKHRSLYRIVRQAEFVDEELYRWYYRRLAEGYATGLQGSMAAGEIRRLDPETLAYALMGVADFIGMRFGLWEQEPVPDSCFEDLMSFIEHGLSRTAQRGATNQQPQ